MYGEAAGIQVWVIPQKLTGGTAITDYKCEENRNSGFDLTARASHYVANVLLTVYLRLLIF